MSTLSAPPRDGAWGRLGGYLAFPPTAGQVLGLDALRAFAILLVLLRHGVLAEGTAPVMVLSGWDGAAPLKNGWVGVDLFFVLSGYLIAGALLKRGAPGLGGYVAGRALRILPAYYTILLVAAFGLVPFYQVLPESWEIRLIYHFLFLQDYFPANFVVAFWSLGVEEKFYMLAPLLVLPLLAYRPRRALMVIGAMIVLAPLLRLLTHLAHPWVSYYRMFFYAFRSPFHNSMDAPLIGVLAVYAAHDPRLRAAAARHAGALFWIGAAGLAAHILPVALLDSITLYDKVFQGTVLGLACGALVLGAALGGGPRRLLGAAWLRVTARLSYCLYLVHLTLIPLTLHLLSGVPAFAAAGTVERFAIFLPAYGALSLAAALVLHYAVEKPALVFKARVFKARSGVARGRPAFATPVPA